MSCVLPPATDPSPLGQALVDNLNRNVLESCRKQEPAAAWYPWKLGDRLFRMSPDGKQARELMPDGFWTFVLAKYVLKNAQRR